MSEKIDQLERLSQLLDEGRITPEEYQALKSEILEGTRSGPNERAIARDTESDRKSDSARPRSFGVVAVWVVSGFVLGVLVNLLIDTIGISISGVLSWDTMYRSTWVRTLVPYATAAGSGLVAAARGRRRRTIYLDAAIMIGVITGVAVLFVINS